MSEKLKCPFCGEELLKEGCIHEDGTNEILWLRCDKCKIKSSDPRLWQELIRTRKALEIAITGLKNCKTRDHIGAVCRTPEYVDKVLEQITALKQKDK